MFQWHVPRARGVQGARIRDREHGRTRVSFTVNGRLVRITPTITTIPTTSHSQWINSFFIRSQRSRASIKASQAPVSCFCTSYVVVARGSGLARGVVSRSWGVLVSVPAPAQYGEGAGAMRRHRFQHTTIRTTGPLGYLSDLSSRVQAGSQQRNTY